MVLTRNAFASTSGAIDISGTSPIHFVTGRIMPTWSCANWEFLPSRTTGTPSSNTITGTDEVHASARPMIALGVAALFSDITPTRPLTRAYPYAISAADASWWMTICCTRSRSRG